jgi:molecular chaperone Hsp33
MHDRDCLHRFIFEQYPIRGHLVHLDAAWRALTEHREYPPAIRDTLGEAVAASLLLAATIKFEGDGPVHLMLAQCTSGLGVRGLARYREGGEMAARAAAGRIVDLIGTGNLTVTLETDEGARRYQGIVPIAGERLADSLQHYFENSEQLPTRLWLHADATGASGMLIQRLPNEDSRPRTATPDMAAVDDAWRRVQLIGDTLTFEELRTLRDVQILHRLFNEDDVRLYEPAPVYFRCRCSRERVGGMLQGLGETETRSVLAERGEVEVRCDFCNRAYVFDAVDVAQLFKASVAADSGSSVH